MELWSARFDFKPVAKARARVTSKGWAYTPSKQKKAEDDFKKQLISKNPPKLTGALTVSLTFQLVRPKSSKRAEPTTRPDLDNYVKFVFDACNEILWKDDAQVTSLIARKEYAPRDSVILSISET